MWNWSVLMPGYSAAMAAKRSSQYGMLWMMPFDFVAEVTCLIAAAAFARSKA